MTLQNLFTFIVFLTFSAFVYWLSNLFPNSPIIAKLIQALAFLLAFIAVIQFGATLLGVTSPIHLQ